jgi:hypothetical protein
MMVGCCGRKRNHSGRHARANIITMGYWDKHKSLGIGTSQTLGTEANAVFTTEIVFVSPIKQWERSK